MSETAAVLSVAGVRIRHEGSDRFTPDGVGFTVRPGEAVLVLGPSGSGKSTLALALNGLVPHAVPAELEGEVRVAGLLTATTPVARLSEHVGIVFQDPDAQIVTATVLDEVCFGPENLRVPVAEVLERAERALRRVGLWERRHENPDRLSGGGRQRLAIACVLALDSPVIVLDEPTANLDPLGVEEVYAVLRELVADGGHTLVLIEHALDAAMEVIDRVIVLDGAGRLVLDGPPDLLRENAALLLELGVWLPGSLLAGLRLRAEGFTVPELPLTPPALTALLDTLRPAPAEPGRSPVARRASASAPTPAPTSASASAPAVTVRDLRVARSRVPVLHGIDLEIPAGSFTAIVGENGAGKTTLLQAVAGVIPPPRRSVDVLGLDPARADVGILARTIGFVFQNPEHQFIRGTVAEELAHGLELQRLPRAEIDRRVDRMLDRFGLAEQRDAHPFLLSGGQKRRLSVGTAIIAGAPVLALDEPTFGQDRARARELLELLTELNRAGTTVLVVTHDLQLVVERASHVVVLRDGRLIAHGRTDVVLRSGALERARLAAPPLTRAFAAAADPLWHQVTRLADLGRLRPDSPRTGPEAAGTRNVQP